MITPNPALHATVTHDGAVILDSEHNQLLTLNPIAGYIWKKLQSSQPIPLIINEIVSSTGADPHTVEKDVGDFVDDLLGRGLLIRTLSTE